MTNLMLDAAFSYAAKGFHVFPLIGKAPAIPGGFYAATVDQDQIREWWSQRPDWNIGIRTGVESGVWVLDVDHKGGGPNGFRTLESLTGDLEWIVGIPFQKSSSGGHFFFQCDDPDLKGSVGKIGPGIDVRANGGYIVASPSIHPDTGKPYEWLNGRSILNSDLRVAPDWLIELAKKQKILPPISEVRTANYSRAYGAKALAGECHKIESASRGSQAQTLNDVAFRVGKLIATGALDELDAERQLKMSASKMVNFDQGRPWSSSELHRIISKGIADGKLRHKL